MLDLMRKHAKSWVINIMIAAIAVVFAFWGVGSFRKQAPNKVAVVNGEPISVAEFQDRYRRLLKMVQNQYRDFLTDELLQAMNLKQQALDQLISEKIMFQQAAEMGIEITARDLQREIAANPAFQLSGRFNDSLYQRKVGSLRMTTAQYEYLVRQDMISRRLTTMIGSLARVTVEDAREYFHLAQDKVDLDYVLFPPQAFRDQVKPSPEEIQAYFKKHIEDYRIPARAKAAYLAMRPKDFEGRVTVSDDDIADYYELNLDKFREPEQVKARHILFRLPRNAPDNQVAEVRAKAEKVLKAAREGGDFAKLAMEHSQGPTGPKGGDLGWFGQDQMASEFSQAAFKMKKGDISDLIRTDFGFHIIMLEDRRAARNRTIEETREEIKKEIIRTRSSEMAADLADRAYEQVTLSRNLEEVAKNFDLTVRTTDFFTESTPLDEDKIDLKFNQMALSLKKDEIGPILDLPDGHYIIRCLEKEDSRLPALEEARDSVREDLSHQQALEAAQKAAADLIALVKKDGDWDKAVKTVLPVIQPANPDEAKPEEPKEGAATEEDEASTGRIAAGETGPFSRRDAAPGIRGGEAVSDAAFKLGQAGAVGSEPIKADRGYYVIRLKGIIKAPEDGFEKGKEDLLMRLQANKGRAYFQKWLEGVKARSEIKVEEGVL